MNIIVSEKIWNKGLIESLQKDAGAAWKLIDNKEDFTFENLSALHPGKIFIPHWSYIIPEDIYSNFECIVFHMTDLPFGRGGSPLQNLIVRGFTTTKISALRVVKELDAGDIYLKQELSLDGNAAAIFERANAVIEKMIRTIATVQIVPQPQSGEVVHFKRRKPGESDISGISEIEKIYDHIRMLDAESYPKAFVEQGDITFEFSNAVLKDNEIIAHVRIFKK
jgi:methionyl-tRNA formyltransferase